MIEEWNSFTVDSTNKFWWLIDLWTGNTKKLRWFSFRRSKSWMSISSIFLLTRRCVLSVLLSLAKKWHLQRSENTLKMVRGRRRSVWFFFGLNVTTKNASADVYSCALCFRYDIMGLKLFAYVRNLSHTGTSMFPCQPRRFLNLYLLPVTRSLSRENTQYSSQLKFTSYK